MKRTFLILLILSLAFVSFSCRKTEKSASVQDSAESAPDLSFQEEKKAPLVLSAGEQAEENDDTAFTLNEIYRGGDILIRAEFNETEGTLYYNIGKEEMKGIISRLLFARPEMTDVDYTLSDGEIVLKYSAVTEERIGSEWKEFKNFLNSYNSEKASIVETSRPDELIITRAQATVKGTLKAVIHPDRAEITIPDMITGSELEAFLSYLIGTYPEVLSFGKIQENGNSLTLLYSPSFSNDDASSLFVTLVSLIDSYFTLNESSAVEEKKAGEDVKSEISAGDVPVASPEEKENSIRKFRVSAVMENAYDTRYAYSPSAHVRIDYAVTPNFSIGVLSGFDFTCFVPVAVSARYYTHMLPPLFLEGTFGALVGVGRNRDYGEYFSIASLGWEHSFSERWALFAGAGFSYIWGKRSSGMRFGLSIGTRVSL